MRRYPFFKLLAKTIAICAFLLAAATSAPSQVSKSPANSKNAVKHCRHVKDGRSRMHCYAEANSAASIIFSQQEPVGPGTWRLARAPNTAGPDLISTTKDASRPSQDIAGLMLRCGEGASIEVLVLLIESMPQQTHPKVTVIAGRRITEFTGSVVGASVLLPEKASALAENDWQSISELAVVIAENDRSLHGTIMVHDLGTAVQTPQSKCTKGPSDR